LPFYLRQADTHGVSSVCVDADVNVRVQVVGVASRFGLRAELALHIPPCFAVIARILFRAAVFSTDENVCEILALPKCRTRSFQALR
jgi:hypothetical protein